MDTSDIPHACGKVVSMHQIGDNDFEMCCVFCSRVIGDWTFTPRKKKSKQKYTAKQILDMK